MSKQTDLINVTDAITVSGSNVGIGTSSPDTKLDVEYGSGNTYPAATVVGPIFSDKTASENFGLNIFSDNASNASINFGDEQLANAGRIVYDHNGNANTMSFYTSAAERMRIDSSGNVGIGTSSPTTGKLVINSTQTGTEKQLVIRDSTNGWTRKIGLDTSNNLGFFDGDTERLRIDSSGSLLVGTTDASPYGAPADGFIVAISDGTKYAMNLGANGTSNMTVIRFNNPNGGVGGINTSGNSTIYYTSSDYRLKTDAQPMTGASARVQALNPVNFEWLSDGSRVDGFLAHEAQEVVPECATGTKDAMKDEEYEVTPAIEATYDDDGNELTPAVDAVMGTRSVPDYQGIDQSKLVPLLTAALQEALTKIDDMETRLAALEAV